MAEPASGTPPPHARPTPLSMETDAIQAARDEAAWIESATFTPTSDHPLPADRAAMVAVLMSGGVDSSVSAWRLLRAGRSVVGVTMAVPRCVAGRVERRDAPAEGARMAAHLGIPHFVLDVGDRFAATVLARFLGAYGEGRTPNPCIDCNRFVKLGAVWGAIAAHLGVDHVATGHYAALARVPVGAGEAQTEAEGLAEGRARTVLRRLADSSKDQTYFLYGLARERLARFHLPLLGQAKDQTRAEAKAAGLPVADRGESMELCFADGGDYRAALPERTARPGPILDVDGRILGEHPGVAGFTLGQRRGVGVALGEPAYVLAIRPTENAIVIGTRAQALRDTVTARAVNIHWPEKLRPGGRYRAKHRSVGPPRPCTLVAVAPAAGCLAPPVSRPTAKPRTAAAGPETDASARPAGAPVNEEQDPARAGRMTVVFDEPVFAPAPGQHLVLYDEEDHLIAGGEIASTGRKTDQDSDPRAGAVERA